MLDQIALQVQAMEPVMFYIFLGAALLMTGFGFKLWRDSFAHARIMEDMPTSKIRSAAQGFVELVGTQHFALPGGSSAPLSSRSATWWRYKIEEKRTRRDSEGNKKTEWHTLEEKTSPDLILLKDATGEVVVNPAGAAVTATEKKTWYGNERRPTHRAGSTFLSMGSRYRYTEEIMRPGDPLYALGHFETRTGAPGAGERQRLRGEILAEWKENPAELASRFDADGDGRVDMDEWERARAAAEAVVEERVAEAAMEPDTHLLLKPPDTHPFILSVKSQDELTKHYRIRAVGFLALFLVGGVALGVLVTARFGA